jgi:hypothetical protein
MVRPAPIRAGRAAGPSAVLLALLLAGAATPAAAASSWHLGVRAGLFESTGAADTWDALYGGDTMTQLGAQAELRFERGWFLALAADRGEVDGELVGVGPGGGLVPTGEPTTLTLTPIHLTIGGVARPGSPWQVYYGGGPSLLLWEDDNAVFPDDGSDGGLHAVLGLRRSFTRAEAAAEARWSTFPDSLGEGGVSELLGESDWGGLSLHLVVGFRLGG